MFREDEHVNISVDVEQKVLPGHPAHSPEGHPPADTESLGPRGRQTVWFPYSFRIVSV